ncbi:MAG: hypothetical protein ACREOY_06430 [Candidatus Dormibacteraceae bacterium]
METKDTTQDRVRAMRLLNRLTTGAAVSAARPAVPGLRSHRHHALPRK